MDQYDDLNQTPVEPEQEVVSPAHSSKKWVTPLVGLVMLFIGLGLGYLARGTIGPEATAARGTSTAVAAAVQTRSATNQELMGMIIGETRHFKGDENAPVTIIEFSDYQ